jgi:hypothetical protein
MLAHPRALGKTGYVRHSEFARRGPRDEKVLSLCQTKHDEQRAIELFRSF